MLTLRVNTDLARYMFASDAQKHIRFAASQAVNATAALVKTGERANLSAVLDKPTPFTLDAIGIQKSSRKTLSAVVYMKDRTAWYLEPYEVGGMNRLNSAALLKPVRQKVNQYGNLPRTTTTRLSAQKRTFTGRVFGISGIWKRFPYVKAKNRRLTKANATRLGRRNRLQRPPELLIEFSGAHAATQQLKYRKVAKQIVSKNFPREFMRAMSRAIASNKP